MASKLVGDWNKTSLMLQSLPAVISKGARAALEKDAKTIKETIVKHIKSQDLPWAPLSPITIKLKGHDTIYVDTGELRDSISITSQKTGMLTWSILIGWKPDAIHKDSGLPYAKLIMWLEFGTSKMPARPLIRPVEKELENIINKGMLASLRSIFTGW